MSGDTPSEAILICAPTGLDAVMASRVLKEFGIASEICLSLAGLVNRLERPCGAVLLAEEALTESGVRKLKDTLARQEAWSDLPIVIMVSPQGRNTTGQKVLALFGSSANVSIIERPFHTASLISTLQVLLRARRRQYQVKQLVEELKLALEQRDEFVSLASHELKTPLTSLRLQNQLTKRTLSIAGDVPFPREKLLKNVDTAERQLGRLSRLIEDLLDVSRVRVGKMSIEPREADLFKIALRVVEQMTAQIEAAGCALSFEATEGAIGFWDPIRLEQVVANLVSNALKYGAGKPIRVSVCTESGRAILSVQDHGNGIAPENQKRVFERFERVEGDTSITGLGLGLYIVKQIVELHDGRISLTSTLGEGSTFRVELPLVLAPTVRAIN